MTIQLFFQIIAIMFFAAVLVLVIVNASKAKK